MEPYSPMVLAVSDQGFGNGSQLLLPPATKPEGRKATRCRVDSATLHKEMKLYSSLEPS